MPLSKKGKARLLRLADFLERLPKKAQKHFDMNAWFQHQTGPNDQHGHRFGEVLTRKDLEACGTFACALGWAATMPYAKKDGVVLKPFNGFCVNGKHVFGQDASKRLFGVDREQHFDLFERWTFAANDAKAWAVRCRELVAKWSAA